MPFPKLLLRRRLWVGFLCTALFCGVYVYVHFVKPPKDDVTPSPLPVFHWLPVANTTTLNACRNSQQGYFTVVDELGYLCRWPDLLPSGCCTVQNSRRYECASCLTSGCCVHYEHCVSCCLHPDKQPLLRSILSRSTETFNPLYSSLRDQFELCLSKCRTSSLTRE
ncbi:SREBP regulating gene protein [Geodia barretti]|uniref:SREBP regulating gene protein n=1 Tax=Geodia barretti TaxID=519541 RepID=A0AA35X812_GEOBA|nr:SREBP regulating gene protein [Geodia barretti]